MDSGPRLRGDGGRNSRDAREERGATAAAGGATSDGRAARAWDGARVRALREHLRESQSALAERIGTRQQTISEWETGASQPRRMSRRLLHIVAEEGGFYSAERFAGGERGDHDDASARAPGPAPGAPS